MDRTRNFHKKFGSAVQFWRWNLIELAIISACYAGDLVLFNNKPGWATGNERELQTLIMSLHATDRAASRHFSADEITFICRYGYRLHNAGVIFCQMRRDHFPSDESLARSYWRLSDVTVVLCPCGECVITVYKNSAAFKKDRKKAKYDRQGKRLEYCCPYCGEKQLAA